MSQRKAHSLTLSGPSLCLTGNSLGNPGNAPGGVIIALIC